MSRIGILPVTIPSGTTVDITATEIIVRSSKGELKVTQLPDVAVDSTDEGIVVSRKNESRPAREQHGLQRTLIANAVQGVSEGFSKELEVNGVGYKVAVSGNKITLNLGYSHPQVVTLPEGIEAKFEGNRLTLSGIDKQLVGQIAANIRELRKPEPYKGKGIKYVGERIIRKAGKAAGAGK
ncbi:MAG: 50S ribosomal protein L6 [Candidatus Saccharimonadales bacterium]